MLCYKPLDENNKKKNQSITSLFESYTPDYTTLVILIETYNFFLLL